MSKVLHPSSTLAWKHFDRSEHPLAVFPDPSFLNWFHWLQRNGFPTTFPLFLSFFLFLGGITYFLPFYPIPFGVTKVVISQISQPGDKARKNRLKQIESDPGAFIFFPIAWCLDDGVFSYPGLVSYSSCVPPVIIEFFFLWRGANFPISEINAI